MDYEITHRYDAVDVDPSDFKGMLSDVSWATTPTFLRRGRVARYLLAEPARSHSNPERTLNTAKMKGVGVYDPASLGQFRDRILDAFSDEPQRPTTKPLESFVTYPHVGVNKDGEFAFVYGAMAPIGGILHERALREFNTARILHEAGVPTVVPLFVVRYKGLEFQGEPMGAVVTLTPEPSPYRLSEVQYLAATQRGADADAYAYYERVIAREGVSGDPEAETTRLAVINRLSRKIGALVHDFSKAGLYRYSSEWSNFEYAFETGEVFLTDLDSVHVLDELSAEQKTLQVLRDLGTMVYRLVAKFGTPSALSRYTLTNLLRFDPLAEGLMGYFPEAPEGEVRRISKRLWNAFIPHLFLLKKHEASILKGWSSERRRSYKMDHDLFYILTMTSLFPLFRESELGKMYVSEITQDALKAKAERYLGPRYEYLEYLSRFEPAA